MAQRNKISQTYNTCWEENFMVCFHLLTGFVDSKGKKYTISPDVSFKH